MVEGGFPELEAAFLEQARALRAEGTRLEPFAVLAPNELLRRRLSRALAESGCAHANIYFLTVRNLAERLGGMRLAAAGFSPVRGHGLELTVAMAAAAREMKPKLEYFRHAAQQEGFQRAMLATFSDLKEAGLRPEDVMRAAALLPPRGKELLRVKLADVALLWERVERAKEEHKLYDGADLLEAAEEEAAGSPWIRGLAQFIIYGFYDLTGVQQRLLEACFSRAPATVYFPFREEEAWRYAKPAREWFLANGFVAMPNGPSAECAMRNAPNAQCGMRNAEYGNPQSTFSHSQSALGNPHSEPTEVLIISAPGEAREVAEVVREILNPPGLSSVERPSRCEAEGPRIGILLRSEAGYMELLQETLASAHVSAYFAEGPLLSRLPAGRALLDLAGLAAGRLRRAEVMDFVTSAPLKPAEFPPGAQAAEDYTAEWNALTVEAGIVEGRKEWEDRLANAGCALRAFLEKLFDGLEEVAGQKSWRGFAAALADLYRALIVPDEQAAEALKALDDTLRPGRDGAGADVGAVPRAGPRVLEETRPAVGKFERNEPAVVKLMAARGVPFDVVVVPGLVEKSFPQPARQDPILLDSERKKLNGLLARGGIANRENAKARKPGKGSSAAGDAIVIPLKARRREEEELLFALAAQSARRRLILTFPRLDATTARQRVPSYFLLRQIESALGKPADYAALEKFLQSTPRGDGPGHNGVEPQVTQTAQTGEQKKRGEKKLRELPDVRTTVRIAGRRVPMSLLDPAARDRAVTALEYDLSSFGKAERDKTPMPTARVGFRAAVRYS